MTILFSFLYEELQQWHLFIVVDKHDLLIEHLEARIFWTQFVACAAGPDIRTVSSHFGEDEIRVNSYFTVLPFFTLNIGGQNTHDNCLPMNFPATFSSSPYTGPSAFPRVAQSHPRATGPQ